MTAKEHYDNLLGEVYSWMLGDFDERVKEQQNFFEVHDILPRQNEIAFDLGAGTGIQSLALAALAPAGKLILSWRDLSEERKNTDRFIHVKSDDTRSMTCFLEFFPQHVMIHDLVVEKIDGAWKQRVSSYPKLKLSLEKILPVLAATGFSVIHKEVVRGMTCIIATKY